MVDEEYYVRRVRDILTPELLLAVYQLKFPFERHGTYSGVDVGQFHFRSSFPWMQSFYDLVFHPALEPLSQIPFAVLHDTNLMEVLPQPTAADFPEQCIGLITLLSQTRTLAVGYGLRYTRSFFDPISEKLARQLISLPVDQRPDGQHAWMSRGYSLHDWLIRTLWFWAPLLHSDAFMVADRQTLKKWLHSMRAETEKASFESDPFAALEPADDADLMVFKRLMNAGPPTKSYEDASLDATVADYTFWWIRIFNAHFAITDTCGHYPYWVRWRGFDMTEGDEDFMDKTEGWQYNPDDEPLLAQIRQDFREGVWQPLPANPKYENTGMTSSHTHSAPDLSK